MGKACSAGSLVVVLAAGLCELRARNITLPAADDSHSILNAPRRINLPLTRQCSPASGDGTTVAVGTSRPRRAMQPNPK